MTQKAKNRLTKLADFLAKKVKPGWFNLSSWATRGFLEKECGTTACAAGWATVAFPNQGLELRKRYSDRSILDLTFLPRTGRRITDPFQAAAVFFDIPEPVAQYIFCPSDYDFEKRTKRYVIARIRRVVKTEQWFSYDELIPVTSWKKWAADRWLT